ncbi:MAG: dihydrolipoyllysine-residue acetyltransferase [Vulcanimicrobiaceae bacterium]
MSDPIEVRVPDIGGYADVPVTDVFVKPGDRIAANDSLITLESDKASMEVPSPLAGVVRELKVKVGDKIAEGSVILTLDVSATPATTQATPAAISATPAATPATPPVVPTSPPVAPTSPPVILSLSKDVPQRDQGDSGKVHASPSIRRLAREFGVELNLVRPGGPNGRITRDDVQGFVRSALRAGTGAPAGAAFAGIAPWPKVDFARYGEIERKPLSRIQKISGPNLHRNWVMIPHVTQHDDADVTDLEAFRKQLNAEHSPSGVKVTMLAFLIKAALAALREFPAFNSSLDGEELVYKKYYNVGFAADTPSGLVVPVIKNADRKGVVEIARETAELAAKAREGRLGPADMAGGTFTISSLGSIGGTYFTPIVNAPEVAILGACRASIRPVWDGKRFAPRLIQPLSLSYDHRVIDGAAAARFTSYLAAALADMRRVLL